MNIRVESLGYKAQKNFTDYLDFISSARSRTIPSSKKHRESDMACDYILLSSPPDKEDSHGN